MFSPSFAARSRLFLHSRSLLLRLIKTANKETRSVQLVNHEVQDGFTLKRARDLRLVELFSRATRWPSGRHVRSRLEVEAEISTALFMALRGARHRAVSRFSALRCWFFVSLGLRMQVLPRLSGAAVHSNAQADVCRFES
jgi:hypothetical protein